MASLKRVCWIIGVVWKKNIQDEPKSTRTSNVSIQCVDNQEGYGGQIVFDLPMSEKTSEENNAPLESNVQLSIQCMENQEGLYGQLVFEDLSYPIDRQPRDDPEADDDEGIVYDMEEN